MRPVLNSRGNLYRLVGRISDAGALLDRSLKAAAPLGAYWAGALSLRAAVLMEQLQFEDATPMLERAAAVFEAKHERQVPEWSRTLARLAECYRRGGRLVEAERTARRALEVAERWWGKETPAAAAALAALSSTLLEQRKLPDAEPLAKRSLEIRMRIQGEAHPETAESFDLLARIRAAGANHAAAEEFYTKAIKAFESQGLTYHPRLVGLYRGYAAALRSAGRPEDSEAAEKRASAIQSAIGG